MAALVLLVADVVASVICAVLLIVAVIVEEDKDLPDNPTKDEWRTH